MPTASEKGSADTRSEVARATLVLGAAHLVQVAASFANLEVLTRFLGPTLYGEYAAVVAAYVVLGALTDLGTGLAAVRAMARTPERARETLVATLRLRFALGVLAAGIGVAVLRTPAGFAGAALPLVQAWSSSRLLLQATLEKTKLARALVLGRVFQVAFVFLAMRAHPEPFVALAALAAGELAIAALLRLEVGALPRIAWRDSLPEVRALALAALPIAGAFLANELAGSLDVLLLKAWKTSEETGLYALASRPLQVLEPVPRLLLWSVFPILSQKAALGDEAALARTHRGATLVLGGAGVLLALGAALAGPRLLAALFDPRYEQASGPLVVLATAAALGFAAAPAESTLVALGRTRENLVASVAALAVNVAANALLIPERGMLGAAWAWLATSVVQLVLAHAFVLARLK